MNRVLMTQSGFVTIVPVAPAVIAAVMWVMGESAPGPPSVSVVLSANGLKKTGSDILVGKFVYVQYHLPFPCEQGIRQKVRQRSKEIVSSRPVFLVPSSATYP